MFVKLLLQRHIMRMAHGSIEKGCSSPCNSCMSLGEQNLDWVLSGHVEKAEFL